MKPIHVTSHIGKKLHFFTVEDHLESFKDQGFSISYNPSRGGNCQFSELLHLLQLDLVFTGLQEVVVKNSKLSN